MSIDIECPNRLRLAEAKRIEVHGLPGLGSYTLVIGLQFAIFAPKIDTYFQHLSLRLDWGDNRQRMIGTALPDQSQPIRITQHSNELSLYFRIPLSPYQMEAIESFRNGGDFKLAIWLAGQVVQGEKTSDIQRHGEFTVRQQEWVEALERMEYRRTLLYEMSLPGEDKSGEPAAELIRKAQRHLLHGHYDQCVGECRKLLEAYPLSASDEKLLSIAREKYKGDGEARKSMDIAERLIVLRDALTHATHLAHHYHNGNGYSRDQASAILGVVVSLMSAFSR